MEFGYFFLFMGGLMTVMIAMMTATLGSLNAQQSGKGVTLIWMIALPLIFAGMFALSGYGLTAPYEMYFLKMAAIVLVAGFVPVPFVLRFGRNFAANQMAHAQATTAWALATFDQLVEPGTNYITEESLHRLLRDQSTSDENRRSIGALLKEFRKIATKIGEEKGYWVMVETKTTQTPYTADYLGITRGNLQAWPNAVHDKRRSWLP